jgi:hypothetical protein
VKSCFQRSSTDEAKRFALDLRGDEGVPFGASLALAGWLALLAASA